MKVIANSAIAKLNAYGPVYSPGYAYYVVTPKILTMTTRMAVPNASNAIMLINYLYDLPCKSIFSFYNNQIISNLKIFPQFKNIFISILRVRLV